MRVIGLLILCLLVGGCEIVPSPGTALRDADVVEGPVLIQRGDRFYLRYRRAIGDLGLALPLVAKLGKDAGYYYFGGNVSHPEWGNLIERPLDFDGFTELARTGRVFWLDPDGMTHPIPVRKDAPSDSR
ncbi:MAG: hypothetical protein AB1705_13275 [Verrucomicrobiota bacterium]